jgi:hypothetical protein
MAGMRKPGDVAAAAGTAAFDEELALKNAIAERDRVRARLEEHESLVSGLTGTDKMVAESQIEQLRTQLGHCEWTVRRFTLDENKRLRRGVATLEEIHAAVDRVKFQNDGSRVWFGYGVAGDNDPVLLESLMLAIYRLNRGEYNAATQRIRDRASKAPRDSKAPMVW